LLRKKKEDSTKEEIIESRRAQEEEVFVPPTKANLAPIRKVQQQFNTEMVALAAEEPIFPKSKKKKNSMVQQRPPWHTDPDAHPAIEDRPPTPVYPLPTIEQTKRLDKLNPLPSTQKSTLVVSANRTFVKQVNSDFQKAILDIRSISNSTASSNNHLDPLVVFQYLQALNLEKTVEQFREEANLSGAVLNYIKLKHYIDRKDFGRAVVLVQTVLQRAATEGASLLPCKPFSFDYVAFEDLMYVLSKYLLISLVQQSQTQIAERTLKMVILPMVQKEQKRGGIRAEWFVADFQLLDNLLAPNVASNNIYKNFNWSSELSKFWASIEQVRNSSSQNPPPLFAYALSKFFEPPKSDFNSLNEVLAVYEKLEAINKVVERVDKNLENSIAPPTLPKSIQYTRREGRVETKYPNETIEFENRSNTVRQSDAGSSSIRSSRVQKYGAEGVGFSILI
jgi:hypothetical protein